uniref:Endo/exonuclease/phosphatase domain-containing protein n=1 Tax=Pristionchus pacificus TaxID=54126 RepID=A0A4X3PCI6_PRIPA
MSTNTPKAPLPAAARAFRAASQESVEALSKKVDMMMGLLSELLSLHKTVPPPSLTPPIPLSTPSVAPVTDIARQIYEGCVKAIDDKAAYEEKEKRVVVIGMKEDQSPTENAEKDEKLVESLVLYSGDPEVKKAFDAGQITHHRHPKDKPPGNRPLKIQLPSKCLRDAMLDGIRSKRGRPPPLPAPSFIRKDLSPNQLDLERAAREEVKKKNIEVGSLTYGLRDYSIITYRNPRALPPNYSRRSIDNGMPPMNKTADTTSDSSTASAAAAPTSVSSSEPVPEPRPSHFSQSSFVASSLAHSPPVSTRQHNDTSSPVSLYYANARSIRCKSPQLSFILSSSQFRIICISESWLDHSDCDSLLVGGFSDYHSFRTDRVICENYGRGGGVACIVHSSLNPVLISSFSSPLIESCIVDLHPPITPSSPFKKIRLVTVYRSPSSPLSSLVSLLEHLEPLLSDEFPCVLVGDFNFPSIDWVSLSSPMPNDFLDFIAFHRFHQYVSFPSRLNNFLDLVFCNQDLIDNSSVFPLLLHVFPSPPVHIVVLIGNQSIIVFSPIIGPALNSLDAHESYDYFVDFVNHTLDTFVPMSKPSPHSRYPKNVRILYSKSRLLSRIAPNSIACKQMSQRFTVDFDRFHCSLENRIVSSSNSKMFYSYCNDKLKPPKSTPSAILDSDGRLLLTNDQKCIAFDRYFCSVFTTPKLCNLPAPTSLHSFDLPFISAHDVIYALSKLAPKVNVTPDRIPSVVLSKCKLSIISPLVIIYNKSLLTSQPSCDPIVVKDLGVHFSPSLSFSTHINKILCSL